MYFYNLPMIKCIGIVFWGKNFLAEPPRSRFFRCWRLRAVFMIGAGAAGRSRSRSLREPVGAGAGAAGSRSEPEPGAEPPKQGGSATLLFGK